MKNKKIAILGATSHIAKGLIYNSSRKTEDHLVLFARDCESVDLFLQELGCENKYSIKGFSDFFSGDYDVIINCVGLKKSSSLKKMEYEIFRLTESFDSMVIEYLAGHPETLYINFSSGAVYGDDFKYPSYENTRGGVDVNNLKPENYYAIARRNSEAKHRALSEFNIVDLRIFSYFSRFIDITTGFLLSEIVRCVRERRVFVTSSADIIRDFVHPDDLFGLVCNVIDQKTINDVFDVYSAKQVRKLEILAYFEENYALNVKVVEGAGRATITGEKDVYFSCNKKAYRIGYQPEYTSMEAIIEAGEILIPESM